MCNDHINTNIYPLSKFQLVSTIITIVVHKSNFPLKCQLDFKPISTGHFTTNTRTPPFFSQTTIRIRTNWAIRPDRFKLSYPIEPLPNSTRISPLKNSLHCVFLMCYLKKFSKSEPNLCFVIHIWYSILITFVRTNFSIKISILFYHF